MIDLKELRLKCKDGNIPIISQETENFLWETLQKLKPKICLEIWWAVWYSAIFTANKIKEWWWKVYSFEISYPAYLEWLNNIRKSCLSNITTYPFDFVKADITKLISKKIEFVFVDGQKSQYANYLEKLENIVSKDTFIVIDDVIKYHNKLDTLYWYLEKKQINYKIENMEEGDGIMIIWSLI